MEGSIPGQAETEGRNSFFNWTKIVANIEDK